VIHHLCELMLSTIRAGETAGKPGFAISKRTLEPFAEQRALNAHDYEEGQLSGGGRAPWTESLLASPVFQMHLIFGDA
jgi:hypothetical protein